MKSDQKIFNAIETRDAISNKKINSLIFCINTTIDLYNHYHYLNPDLSLLVKQRSSIKQALKGKLSMADIKKLTDDLKTVELRRSEIEWHYLNAPILADQKIIQQLIDRSFYDCQNEVRDLLTIYQEASSYILHTANRLNELALELLPLLENSVEMLLKNINKKADSFKQVLVLKTQIHQEKTRIAQAMALRIEAAFYYENLVLDDGLVYVYNRLIQSGSLNTDAPLRQPRQSLDVTSFTQFYHYIQLHGAPDVKERLNKILSQDVRSEYPVIKIETRIQNDKIYRIPFELRSYIPLKKPKFSKGAKLRYEFFQQHVGTVTLLEAYSRFEEKHHPNNNVYLLLAIRDAIREHRKIVNKTRQSIGGFRGLFMGKTKRFLQDWQGLLQEQEERSWIRHYDALKKQAADYLQYSDDLGVKREALLEKLSIFMLEIDKSGPPFSKQFLPELKRLKTTMDRSIVASKQLVNELDKQLETTKRCLDSDSLHSFKQSVSDDAVSLSSTEIDQIEEQIDHLEEYSDVDLDKAKKQQVLTWASGLFSGVVDHRLEGKKLSEKFDTLTHQSSNRVI